MAARWGSLKTCATINKNSQSALPWLFFIERLVRRWGLRCGFYCGRSLLRRGDYGGGRSFHGLWRVFGYGFTFRGLALRFFYCGVRAFVGGFACVLSNRRGNGGKRSGNG